MTFLCEQGVGWVIQIFLYHPPSFHQLHGKKRSTLQEFKRIDHFGVLLLVAGLTLFLLGISWGGNPRPWTSALILSLIIVGGVTLIAFVFWEAFTPSPNPMVDLRVFRNRGFVCLNIVSMAAGAMYIALSIIWPQRTGFSTLHKCAQELTRCWQRCMQYTVPKEKAGRPMPG